jgi:hypothetical protein
MAYTLKRSIQGLSDADICRIYNSNLNMTLRELSNLTGYAVPYLKKILLSEKPAPNALDIAFDNPMQALDNLTIRTK